MQLLWLICHLAVVIATPLLPSSSFIRTRRTADTINDNNHESQKQEICETAYCHEIAKQIQQNMDTTANPCENFYQYACGSWGKNNPVPEGMDLWSEAHNILEKTRRRIKELLEEDVSSTDIPPVRMIKELYRSCMDVDAIEKRGFEPIQEMLNRTGGWPMAMPVSEWDEIPWQKIDKEYMSSFSGNAFYSFGYENDPNNKKRHVLAINSKIKYPTSNKRDPIEAYMADITYIANTSARQNGYTLDENQLTSDVEEMVHFELLLTEIITKYPPSTADYKRITIEELQEYYNNFNVTAPTAKMDFLEMMQDVHDQVNIHVNSSELIILFTPKFLHQVATLLGNTSQRTLVNYVQWNMVNKFLSYTTQKMRDIKFAKSDNSTDPTPRWKICIEDMGMKNAISYMFVKRYTSDYVIHEATKLVKNIQKELRNDIEQTHWLPSSIKVDLLEKIDDNGIEVGYPAWYKNDDAVTRYYDGLSIGSDYFQNILNVLRKKLQNEARMLRQVVEKNFWVDYPISFNAYYDSGANTIFILASLLLDPYFTPRLPDAVNYGAVGFIIGHELAHNSDRSGIKYDKEGNEIAWKSYNASKEYDERAKCFIDQYSNYIVHVANDTKQDIKLNGTQTNDEDIADSIGLRIVYSAYKKVAKEKIQSKLPGFENISNDKLFFLSFANTWCTVAKSGYDAYLATDEHSPGKYRIIGILSNMAEFSETFNCPQNNSMSRQHKCTLWD